MHARRTVKMIRYRAIVTMEDEQKLVCDLSNGAIANDLEGHQPRFQGHDIIQRQMTRKWCNCKIEL